MRFLFVKTALCLQFPSDFTSRWRRPCRQTNSFPCRVCRRLTPLIVCALPGALNIKAGVICPSFFYSSQIISEASFSCTFRTLSPFLSHQPGFYKCKFRWQHCFHHYNFRSILPLCIPVVQYRLPASLLFGPGH